MVADHMKGAPEACCRIYGNRKRCSYRLALWIPALLAAFLTSTAYPQGLWVLQEPDKFIEYDVDTFAVRRTIKVPHRLLEEPSYVRINAGGQILFLPPRDARWGGEEPASAAGRLWFLDGRRAGERNLEGPKTRNRTAGRPTLTETARQWFLTAEGESLLRFENIFEKILDDSGLEKSMRTSARVWRTDLAGESPEAIADLSSDTWCQCATGICSETCLEWSFWSPDGIVKDFFLLTSFTPGQIGATYHESFLYQRAGKSWQHKKLSQPLEKPLAASHKGDLLVAAVFDRGCCGWENDSSDQILLLQNGKVSVLYDEFARYDNRNYDVSFHPANACLAVGNSLLAYSIFATARKGGEIRLASEGKENPAELARVRKIAAELPIVEVVDLGSKMRTLARIRHAALVGWLNDLELLVAQDGRLVVYDPDGVMRRETPIRVRSAADAFLR